MGAAGIDPAAPMGRLGSYVVSGPQEGNLCPIEPATGIGGRPRGRYRVHTPFPMKRPTLLTQVLAVNALLITATVFAASVAASLHSDPIIERKRFLVLVAALMAMVLVNGWLLRRRFAPLEELIDAMERVDFGGRDPRAALPPPNGAEGARLHQAFDTMLARLEAERA